MARKKVSADVIDEIEATAKPILSAALDEAEHLAAMLEKAWTHFKREFAEEYESLRLCPLQHGLEAMIDKLKG